MFGYTRDSMGLNRDRLVNVNSSVCQDIADSLFEGVGIDVNIVGYSNAFDLVPHDRLIVELSASGVDARVVVWVREFLVGHPQRARLGEQIFREVKLTSGVSQGSFLGPLLFLV